MVQMSAQDGNDLGGGIGIPAKAQGAAGADKIVGVSDDRRSNQRAAAAGLELLIRRRGNTS